MRGFEQLSARQHWEYYWNQSKEPLCLHPASSGRFGTKLILYSISSDEPDNILVHFKTIPVLFVPSPKIFQIAELADRGHTHVKASSVTRSGNS